MVKNDNSVYNNVNYVFTIGDIHGDYDVFKKTILDIGRNKNILKFTKNKNSNIFQIYTKKIFGVDFELCKINKNLIKDDNFIIVQLGDLVYSAFNSVQNDENEEIRLLMFMFSLYDEFKKLENYGLKCKYIQLLGNHDILLLSSPKETILMNSLKHLINQNIEKQQKFINIQFYQQQIKSKTKTFITGFNNQNQVNVFNQYYSKYQTYVDYKKIVWDIKTKLLNIGLIFCKINNILYTHCFFNTKTIKFIYNQALEDPYFNYQINLCLNLHIIKNFQNILIEIYNKIFKNWIVEHYSLNLSVDEVFKKYKKKISYFTSNLINGKLKDYEIKGNLKIFFDCNEMIIGHIYNENYIDYFDGLVKVLDIGVSKKMINRFSLKRNFNIFYSIQNFNNLIPKYYLFNNIKTNSEFSLIYQNN